MLCSYPFPGNVRELENLMERFAALGAGGILSSEVFPDNASGGVEFWESTTLSNFNRSAKIRGTA